MYSFLQQKIDNFKYVLFFNISLLAINDFNTALIFYILYHFSINQISIYKFKITKQIFPISNHLIYFFILNNMLLFNIGIFF